MTFDKPMSTSAIENSFTVIRHDDNGRPYLNVNDKISALFEKYGVTKSDISISHTDDTAIAVCILE